MLLALSLKDFVIVDQLHLNFQSGLTVITGETGAGKSITLDALGLLLGDKADFSQVRVGQKEAQLSALFDITALHALQDALREQGLMQDDEDKQLSIRRIIDAKGKSRSFINGQTVTLSQLRDMGAHLVDIHGQNAHQSLNKEAMQRQLLDAFAGAQELSLSVKHAYQTWQQAQKDLQDALNSGEQLALEQERLQWQLQDLEQHQLSAKEWDELNQSHDALAHAADILEAAQWVDEAIDGASSVQQRLYQCQQRLSHLAQHEPRFQESLPLLLAVEAELAEVASSMRDVCADVDINPQELAVQAERIQTLNTLARKYRVEPPELFAKQQSLQDALNQLEAAGDTEALEQAVNKTQAAFETLAQQLSAKRQQAAQLLAAETTERMQELAMNGSRFAIELLASNAGSHGLEHVQFLVAANKGNPLRPMAKVASGGELSRISLALQVVTSRLQSVPTLIFDEVDSGIGGRVAEVVGKSLRQLGQHYQVLAITHLPQVAAFGNQHWQVSKRDVGETTLSQLLELVDDARTEEIARMLGGETITTTTREHAKEMLIQAAAAI
ncbi:MULTISPECIES: DNA repair protein RecN [Vitreoscilla]|uniref:DNA repair protein RecN n=1 Tax=Vitreoscilla stercoraria TaxID=61 RepID=A0ABY4E8Q2_VITST|nr:MULTISPECIES: DNA repair protein RecN [Vitreoscilla]AUZ04577.2 DNA recombination/repair protein RecN [Vitreoscilla sp. C1]UOO91723.1 DNA repair protein RecN [Vitreoscilla stercoraria]